MDKKNTNKEKIPQLRRLGVLKFNIMTDIVDQMPSNLDWGLMSLGLTTYLRNLIYTNTLFPILETTKNDKN